MKNTDIISINIIEGASSLAELHLIRDFREMNPKANDEEIESMIYAEDSEGCSLTEQAQVNFDILYDLYYDLLNDLKK